MIFLMNNVLLIVVLYHRFKILLKFTTLLIMTFSCLHILQSNWFRCLHSWWRRFIFFVSFQIITFVNFVSKVYLSTVKTMLRTFVNTIFSTPTPYLTFFHSFHLILKSSLIATICIIYALLSAIKLPSCDLNMLLKE